MAESGSMTFWRTIRRFFRWLADRIKDLFYGPGNMYLDLGRILATVTAVALVGAQLWNIYLGKEIDLGPGGLGGGLAAVITAIAALIAAKDMAHTNAVSRVSQDATAAVEADTASRQADTPSTIVEGNLQADNIENVEVKP
jgi:hypothetical protein